ncbi:MAG: hypothetical protein IPO99_20305 [Nitrospira sp.]|nr:hypothetical protein [Nitrospira sp.]
MVAGCLGVAGWCPVEASDHPVAKSLMRTGFCHHGHSSRTCASDDLPGNWHLVAFDSSCIGSETHRLHICFLSSLQHSHRGGAKSAHSLQPLSGDPDQLFEAVPLDMTYRVEGKGRVVLKTRGHTGDGGNLTCRVITQDPEAMGDGTRLQRGDLVMT